MIGEKAIICILIILLVFHISSLHLGITNRKLDWIPVAVESLPSELMLNDDSSEVSMLMSKKKSLRHKIRRLRRLQTEEAMEMRFEGKTRWKVLVYDSNHQQIFNFSSPQTIFFTSKILDDTYFLDPNEDYLFFLQHPLEEEVKSKVIIHSSSQHLKFENHLEVKTKVIDEREMEKEIEIKRGEMEKEIKDKKLRILDVNDSEMKNGVQYLKIPVDTHDTIFIISTNKSMHFKNHTIEISFDGKKQRWKTDIRGEPVSFLEIRGFDHKGELIVTEDLSSIEIDQSYILPFHIITTTKNELMMS